MGILFKACPRCSGDIDVTYTEDIYCIQCGNRPHLLESLTAAVDVEPGYGRARPRAATASSNRDGSLPPKWRPSGRVCTTLSPWCPKCGSSEAIQLDKLRDEDNTCYRCRQCGHIFSPAAGQEEGRQAATS